VLVRDLVGRCDHESGERGLVVFMNRDSIDRAGHGEGAADLTAEVEHGRSDADHHPHDLLPVDGEPAIPYPPMPGAQFIAQPLLRTLLIRGAIHGC